VGDASEPTARPSPSNGDTDIYKYHQVPLEGETLVSIAIFGCVARGEARSDVDVDILIVARDLPRSRFKRRAF
jgi:predicted nucleotidyltransferase